MHSSKMLLEHLLFTVPFRAKLPVVVKQQHGNLHSVLLSVYIKEEDQHYKVYQVSDLYCYPREQLSLFRME